MSDPHKFTGGGFSPFPGFSPDDGADPRITPAADNPCAPLRIGSHEPDGHAPSSARYEAVPLRGTLGGTFERCPPHVADCFALVVRMAEGVALPSAAPEGARP